MHKSFRPNIRWRQPLSKHVAKLIDHLDVFIRGKGSCNHFHRFDEELVRQTIEIRIQLSTYNSNYCNWITENEFRNPDRFMPNKDC